MVRRQLANARGRWSVSQKREESGFWLFAQRDLEKKVPFKLIVLIPCFRATHNCIL